MEDYENVVVLTDAEENEISYELIDVVPYDGCEYAVLLPLDS